MRRKVWEFARSADAVIVLTEASRRELLSYREAFAVEPQDSLGRIEVVRQGIDFPREIEAPSFSLRSRYGLSGHKPIFLFVGQLSHEKEIAFLLEALGLLARAGEDFHMLLVGEGPHQESFERQTERLGIAGRCLFTGPISDKALLAEHFRQADLFLFPSLYETQGLVVMEAASQGLPTVGQLGAPGLSDTIVHDETGFFSDRTPHAYAELIARLCRDPARRRAVGVRAASCVVRIEDTVKRLGTIYESLIERARPVAPEPPRERPRSGLSGAA